MKDTFLNSVNIRLYDMYVHQPWSCLFLIKTNHYCHYNYKHHELPLIFSGLAAKIFLVRDGEVFATVCNVRTNTVKYKLEQK